MKQKLIDEAEFKLFKLYLAYYVVPVPNPEDTGRLQTAVKSLLANLIEDVKEL